MLSFLSKKHPATLTGIVPGNEGTAIARVLRSGKQQPALQDCHFNSGELPGPDELKLGNQTCTTLLPVGDYQLLVVDAPEVPADEMAAAIRWRIQELIDFNIDDAVLDIFDAPPSGPANSKQLYVVVTHRNVIRARIDLLEQAGARLEYIDIPELAMRNIASCLPEDEAGLISLYFSEEHCLITITHNAELFLTRNIDIGYRDLQEESATPQALCNRIALEIQRSMDYYEHNYHQAAARNIAIYPVPVTLFGLTDALQQTLGVTVRMIDVKDVVNCDANPDDSHAADCLLAVGSALRAEEVTL